jgi:xanthine dehydrogenase accessory factor
MLVLIRGAGELASGVALRLFRSGFQVIMTELPEPLVVRRLVSFAEAVFNGRALVEEVSAQCVNDLDHAWRVIEQNEIPILVDPEGVFVSKIGAEVLVDGRMTKHAPEYPIDVARLVIGLGPGFVAGENCHAAIETNRGHYLGRVIWRGKAEEDTGVPEAVLNHLSERVLRAPGAGELVVHARIRDHLNPRQLVAEVNGEAVLAPFKGVLRGVVHSGVFVERGTKIGDVDPRDDPTYCTLVSDKALAVAGGVLEAILSRSELELGLRG